jgi:hypothetical protein
MKKVRPVWQDKNILKEPQVERSEIPLRGASSFKLQATNNKQASSPKNNDNNDNHENK